MKIQIKFFLYHIFFLFVLISQDTYVSASFFGDDPLLYYITLILLFTSIVCYSGVISDHKFIDSNKQYDSPYFCRSCQVRVPVRAYHCEKCHHCSIRQIYHSEWANTCISSSNYMNYIFFLTSELLNFLFLIGISVFSLHQKTDFSQPLQKLILRRIFLVILIPIWLYYLIQVIILLLQNLFIIFTSGNALEAKKFCGITYLHIQPESHNPFYSLNIDLNLSEVFSPTTKENYEIKDVSKLSLYNEDIANYKGIDYIKDSM